MSRQDASLRDLLDAALARGASRELLTLDDTTWTGAQIDEIASATARTLLDRGVGPGDVVMVLCHNGIAIVATWFACIRVGALFTPLNALLTGAPLRTVMEAAGGGFLVGDERLLAASGLRVGGPAQLMHVLALGADIGPGRESFHSAVERVGRGDLPSLVGSTDAPAKLMFTSGTTGEPKGVVWSRHAEMVHAVSYGDELVRVDPGETVYSCLPLFHATCQGTLIGTLLRGGTAVIDRRFDPFTFWRRTREAGAVFFPYVGTIISALLSRPERDDDRDNPVRRAMGSAAPADRWQAFEERFGVVLEDVWGQTETASCWTHPGPAGRRVGTVGRPSDRFEVRVVTERGGDANAGEPGELWIRPRAPHVLFDGYLGIGRTISCPFDADGWYHTGDRLSRDARGDYEFHGRSGDSIRRRGEMIAPALIEAAATRHESVAEAVAVGVPADDGVEDEIQLVVVPRGTDALDFVALHAFLVSELPPFMVPRYLRTMSELPKTPTTRVRRHLLREAGTAGCWDTRRRQTVDARS